jgi:ankyrin repeat protein
MVSANQETGMKTTVIDKKLLNAAIKGDVDTVDELAQEGHSVNVRDSMGRSALWHAAANGDTDMIMILLKYDAQVNTADRDGIHAVTAALEDRHWKAAELLLETADPNAVAGDKKLTALHSAFWLDMAEEKTGRVKFLLERNASPVIEDYLGKSVLHYAQEGAAENPFAKQLLDIIMEYKDGPEKRQAYLDKKRDEGIREAFSGTRRAIEVPEKATFRPKAARLNG